MLSIENRHVDATISATQEYWPRNFPGFAWEELLNEGSPATFKLLSERRILAATYKMQHAADNESYHKELRLLRRALALACGPVYFACAGDKGKFPVISIYRAERMHEAWPIAGIESWTLQRMSDKNLCWGKNFISLLEENRFSGESRKFAVICAALLVEEVFEKRFEFPRPKYQGPDRSLPDREPRGSGAPQKGSLGFAPLCEEEKTVPQKEDPDKIKFSDIGGQAEATKELMKLAISLNRPELYARWGGRPPRGVLLNGPPGTGKTLLARALANAVNVKFYNIPSSQIKDMYYGQSARNVDKIFKEARETGGVIFFDEADGLFGTRTENTNKNHDEDGTVIAALNRNMDGFEPNDKVVVILATNFVKKLDDAATRAGRIDRVIEVPLPDAEGRKEIFKIHMMKTELRANPWRALFPDVDAGALAVETDGFNGADIAEMIRRAIEAKVFEEDELLTNMLENKAERENNEGVAETITTADLLKEIRKYERKANKKKSDSGLQHRIGF